MSYVGDHSEKLIKNILNAAWQELTSRRDTTTLKIIVGSIEIKLVIEITST